MKKWIRNGMMVGMAALLVTLFGCANNQAKVADQKTSSISNTASSPKPKNSSAPEKVSGSNEQQNPDNVYITVEADAKLGSDGKTHDAFTNGDITLTEGQPVTLHFYNYDEAPHSYTAPDLGLNIELSGSKKDGEPAITTFTFTPAKTGSFEWKCMDPCDMENGQWAMTHDGYMKGAIKVVPAKDAVQHVSLVINADYKLGTDGELHDAFTPGDFTVKAGQPVELTIYNFDDQGHPFVSSNLGLNVKVDPSQKEGQPSVTTTTFVPAKAGKYEWHCGLPCDDWAMAHDNYMMGYVTVE
ncbi:cupredoxin domain-containing protein [Ferviditalea candida]|uniref:Cupredoxin domain-containing protein n=1 Tax=Ferviditalea candida TaxID=3108399 RepID=A0ABU5ZMS5_9BACL|nr:cupredoxin domain-containing protein [Paenibacillaceae bacterium T2]